MVCKHVAYRDAPSGRGTALRRSEKRSLERAASSTLRGHSPAMQHAVGVAEELHVIVRPGRWHYQLGERAQPGIHNGSSVLADGRSEEHTSELQSRPHLVCRLLLEKKKHRR